MGAANQDDHPCHCDGEHRLYALIGDGEMHERPFGDGIVAQQPAAALVYGLGSFEFAMAFIFAIVVCGRDRRAARTGRPAVVVNDIVEAFKLARIGKASGGEAKEFVSHTQLASHRRYCIGVANTFIMYFAYCKGGHDAYY